MSEGELPPQPPEPAEAEPKEQPRIYAASLSDYNAGILHGAWLDVTGDVDELHRGIQAMLAASPTTARFGEPAEEWAIHDYDSWYGLRLGEYEAVERLCTIAAGIAEHGEAFAVWVGNEYRSTEDLASFEDAYLGSWESIEAYAEQLLDDLGIDTEELGPEQLRPYIHFDLPAFARDLAGELNVVAGEHGVYVFET